MEHYILYAITLLYTAALLAVTGSLAAYGFWLKQQNTLIIKRAIGVFFALAIAWFIAYQLIINLIQ